MAEETDEAHRPTMNSDRRDRRGTVTEETEEAHRQTMNRDRRGTETDYA